MFYQLNDRSLFYPQSRPVGEQKCSPINPMQTIIAITLMTAGACGAATVVAEHVLPSNASSWFNIGAGMGTDGRVYDNRQAQTFTTTASGYLSSISFDAYRFASTNADLRISLTTVIGLQPRTVLESFAIPFSLISTTSPTASFLKSGVFTNTINASGSVMLQANTVYAIVFSTTSTEANYRIYGDYSGYSGGESAWFQNSGTYRSGGGDLLFRITTGPVPEASVIASVSVASALLILRRRREANNA